MWNPGGGTDPRSNQIIFDCLLAYCHKHSCGTKARIYTGQPVCGSLSEGMLNYIILQLATGYLGFNKLELDNMLTLCAGIKLLGPSGVGLRSPFLHVVIIEVILRMLLRHLVLYWAVVHGMYCRS